MLQVEAMAQLGGLLMIDPENEAAKNNFFFGGVDNCKWRRPVVPGDCLVSFSSGLMLTAYPASTRATLLKFLDHVVSNQPEFAAVVGITPCYNLSLLWHS